MSLRLNYSIEHQDATKRGYSEAATEFMLAVQEYKMVNDRPFPKLSELLNVLLYLGYRQVAERADRIEDVMTQEAAPRLGDHRLAAKVQARINAAFKRLSEAVGPARDRRLNKALNADKRVKAAMARRAVELRRIARRQAS